MRSMSVTRAPSEETRQVLFDDVGRRLAARGHSKAHASGTVLDLHHQRAQHVDAEAAAALPVLGVLGHGRGDVVVDPVAVGLVVVVGAAALEREGAHLLDGGDLCHGMVVLRVQVVQAADGAARAGARRARTPSTRAAASSVVPASRYRPAAGE